MHCAASDAGFYRDRPCWWCRWWGDFVSPASPHGLCRLPGCVPVKAEPATGCAFFEREPGVDDDLWAPASVGITRQARAATAITTAKKTMPHGRLQAANRSRVWLGLSPNCSR